MLVCAQLPGAKVITKPSLDTDVVWHFLEIDFTGVRVYIYFDFLIDIDLGLHSKRMQGLMRAGVLFCTMLYSWC